MNNTDCTVLYCNIAVAGFLKKITFGLQVDLKFTLKVYGYAVD